ncbi:MAG: CPBP family intramembrane metalloprotease [Spirochaetales bacterium]|nr:CPBP family intramembrane metalloprotease [Spirochaetales bacterium]
MKLKENKLIRDIPWKFFALAFAVSWTLWGIAWIMARGNAVVHGDTATMLSSSSPVMLAFIVLGTFGPLSAAFIMTALESGRTGVRKLWKRGWDVKLGWKWFLVILLLFPMFRLISLLISGEGISLHRWQNPLQLLALLFFLYFLGGPFGEDYGWNGYALPRLLESWSRISASLILGLFWIAWHFPLFFIPGSPQAQISFIPWAISVMSLSFIFTWILEKTRGIIFGTILLHAMVNMSGDLIASGGGEPGFLSARMINTGLQIGTAVALGLYWTSRKKKTDTLRPALQS